MSRILLVEDNELSRDMLHRRLEQEGFEVITATDGNQGISAARSERPDLILMDLSLPELDGWEAARRLKADGETRSIPVIALTAHAMAGDREKALAAGCDDYDIKPVEIDRLLDKIRSLLGLKDNGAGPEAEIAPVEIPDVVRPADEDRAPGAGRLLVVDDNEHTRDMLARRLEGEGFAVVEAESGERALELIEGREFDLILLDIMMPGFTGTDVLKTLRRERAMAELPVIMVTAVSESEDVVEALRLGANDYVTKPIDFPVVLARVRTQLALKRAEDKLRQANEDLERRVAERTAELAAAHKNLHGLVEHLPVGVCLLDAELRLALANPHAKEYLSVLADGVSEGEVVGCIGEHTVEDLLAPGADGLPGEVRVQGPPKRTFEVKAHPVTAGKAEGGWVLALQDVTQEREVRARVQEQDRLAAVGQLAAGIAHDFNNLLTVMMGTAQILDMRADLPGPIRKDLKTIVVEGQRAAQLVQQVLDFSRKTVSQKQTADLAPFLKESVKLLERTFPSNIRIVTDFGGGNYTANVNLTQMQQILTNLAVNARHAMPEGGELRIGLSRLRVEENAAPPLPEMAAGDWVVWAMSDTGTGMPPEVMERIFEPFFTTKERGEGTGLGLAQVHGIVKQHGGEIGVESEEGTGTTFTIYLPFAVEKESRAEPEKPVLPGGRRRTVLVVEDKPEVCKVARGMLESLNYEVLTAANGREALEVFDRHCDEIALVLTDMMMPEMDGSKLCEALRQKAPGVRVVVMTGYSTVEEGRKFPENLAGVLEKPLVLERVAEVVDQALNGASKEQGKEA